MENYQILKFSFNGENQTKILENNSTQIDQFLGTFNFNVESIFEFYNFFIVNNKLIYKKNDLSKELLNFEDIMVLKHYLYIKSEKLLLDKNLKNINFDKKLLNYFKDFYNGYLLTMVGTNKNYTYSIYNLNDNTLIKQFDNISSNNYKFIVYGDKLIFLNYIINKGFRQIINIPNDNVIESTLLLTRYFYEIKIKNNNNSIKTYILDLSTNINNLFESEFYDINKYIIYKNGQRIEENDLIILLFNKIIIFNEDYYNEIKDLKNNRKLLNLKTINHFLLVKYSKKELNNKGEYVNNLYLKIYRTNDEYNYGPILLKNDFDIEKIINYKEILIFENQFIIYKEAKFFDDFHTYIDYNTKKFHIVSDLSSIFGYFDLEIKKLKDSLEYKTNLDNKTVEYNKLELNYNLLKEQSLNPEIEKKGRHLSVENFDLNLINNKFKIDLKNEYDNKIFFKNLFVITFILLISSLSLVFILLFRPNKIK